MRIRFYLISIIVCLSALSVQAQDSSVRQIYNEAEREYDIGRVEQAVSILNDNMDSFSGNVRQSAFRLMALCHLSLDDVKRAAGDPAALKSFRLRPSAPRAACGRWRRRRGPDTRWLRRKHPPGAR